MTCNAISLFSPHVTSTGDTYLHPYAKMLAGESTRGSLSSDTSPSRTRGADPCSEMQNHAVPLGVVAIAVAFCVLSHAFILKSVLLCSKDKDVLNHVPLCEGQVFV